MVGRSDPIPAGTPADGGRSPVDDPIAALMSSPEVIAVVASFEANVRHAILTAYRALADLGLPDERISPLLGLPAEGHRLTGTQVAEAA